MKQILYLLPFLLVAQVASAQFSFGLKAGVHLNDTRVTVTGDGLAEDFGKELNPNGAFHFGAFAQIKLGNQFSLLPEIQYIQRGFSSRLSSANQIARWNHNYIEFPLLIGYSPVKLLQLEAGAVGGYRVISAITSDGVREDVSDIMDEDKFHFGLTGGVRINLGSKASVAAHYHHGLTRFSEVTFRDQNNDPEGAADLYFSSAQLSFAYKLIGKN